MNRFRKAWLALTDRLEPEVREKRVIVERLIPTGDNIALVYEARSRKYLSDLEHHKFLMGMHRSSESHRLMMRAMGGDREPPKPEPVEPERPEWHGRLYRTCPEVFAAHGEDAEASAVKAMIVGNKAYTMAWLSEHDLQPKPKVAKGRK